MEIAAGAVSQQILHSRSGIRVPLPGAALWLERRPRQVEGRWPGAIAAAIGELVALF